MWDDVRRCFFCCLRFAVYWVCVFGFWGFFLLVLSLSGVESLVSLVWFLYLGEVFGFQRGVQLRVSMVCFKVWISMGKILVWLGV